jgi:predicted  nucleic acid-binding Zn ribbon protein
VETARGRQGDFFKAVEKDAGPIAAEKMDVIFRKGKLETYDQLYFAAAEEKFGALRNLVNSDSVSKSELTDMQEKIERDYGTGTFSIYVKDKLSGHLIERNKDKNKEAVKKLEASEYSPF